MYPPLSDLLARCAALFPATNPLVLSPSAGQFGAVAGRYAGGHAARWFAATDGQQGEEDSFADGFGLCSLAYALEAAKIADQIRSEPDGYWVEPHWLAIASDGAGYLFMIDDRDGRVLAVAHDDDYVKEIGRSPEEWLTSLLDGHANGSIVWDEHLGLVALTKLEKTRAGQRVRAERALENATIPTKHKIGLGLTVGLVTALFLFVTWYFETHR